MVEPSQVLVEKYFELEGYYLRKNVKFPVPGNYSDIDLIGRNNTGEAIVVEVKSWAKQDVGWADGKPIIDWITSDTYLKAVESTLGKFSGIRNVLVLAFIGKESRPKLKEYAKVKGVEITTLDAVIKGLLERLDPNPSYDSETLQLLRLLKLYSDYGRINMSFNESK